MTITEEVETLRQQIDDILDGIYEDVVSGGRYLWCEEQVIAYAAQEVAAERERCVRIVEAHRCPVGNSAAGEMAAEWTMEALREIRDAIRGPNAKAFLAPNTNVTGLAPA